MARRRAPESQIAALFATSEERVDDARKEFEAARTSLANARAYGTEAHARAASQAFVGAAESYADAMKTHARLVVDYAKERSDA